VTIAKTATGMESRKKKFGVPVFIALHASLILAVVGSTARANSAGGGAALGVFVMFAVVVFVFWLLFRLIRRIFRKSRSPSNVPEGSTGGKRSPKPESANRAIHAPTGSSVNDSLSSITQQPVVDARLPNSSVPVGGQATARLVRGIFLNYRRDDTEGQAGRLYNDLARAFGADSVFMDVAGIEPGVDFRKVIDKNLSSCSVLLSLIGPQWLDVKDESGNRRLDNSTDLVRLETATALRRDIAVIPILVRGARMPKPEELPDDLKDLAYRNSAELTHVRWDSDVEVLIRKLRRLVTL
jgi:hypothetical protein